jgi:hypothetical protein
MNAGTCSGRMEAGALTGTPRITQESRDIAVGVGLAAAAVFAPLVLVLGLTRYGFGWDSHAYWAAWRHHGLYTVAPERIDAYLYSPLFAELVWPLTLFPWPAFAAVWTAATASMFAWLLWPLPARWRVFCLFLALPEIVGGNIWALFAVVLVIGFRHPAAWAIPALTKVTSSVGFVWFAVRREWRHLLVAAAAVCVLVAISAAADPGLWRDWFVFLAHGGGRGAGYAMDGRAVPPAVRLPAALLIAVIGARRGRPSWLAWSMMLASPVFGVGNLAVLAALPRLRRSTAV